MSGRSWPTRSATLRRTEQQPLELRRVDAAAADLADEEREELRVHGDLLRWGSLDAGDRHRGAASIQRRRPVWGATPVLRRRDFELSPDCAPVQLPAGSANERHPHGMSVT